MSHRSWSGVGCWMVAVAGRPGSSAMRSTDRSENLSVDQSVASGGSCVMSKKKSSHRARGYANPLGSPTPQPDGAIRPSNAPARRDARESHRLLERILDTPHLEHAVPRLQPELLHRVIQSCGLEDCGE